MADKVFVLSLDILDGDVMKAYEMPVADLEKIAYKVLTPKQAVMQLNNIEFATFNPEEYFCVYREIEDEEIHVKMGKDDWQEIIINEDLHIHVNTNGGEGYNVDLYAYHTEELGEDHDYGEDFITSCYASFEELDEARGQIEE